METPIVDFVRDYAAQNAVRLHMPGHKGRALLGPEPYDITEIPGADVLYAPEGVIRRSEENAARLFGSLRTVYSAEGSSLCIRAMLALVKSHAAEQGKAARILAGRNAHKVFVLAAGLLGLELSWLYGEENDGVLRCRVTAEDVERALCEEDCAAVYLTSPDYLGNTADLPAISAVCRRHGALLLVDNAHGAYLRFLSPSRHPLDLGADLCCDSAHKTLPALTGAAYLHFAASVPALAARAEAAMQLFASTSPSYLILQSLDACNALLAGDYPARIRETAARVDALKARLPFPQRGDEPLKLCLCPKARGWTGDALAARLAQQGIVCEFADPDNLVFMFSPENSEDDFRALEEALASVPAREPIRSAPPVSGVPEIVCAPREALFAPQEELPTARCLGRVLAAPTVSCPPAVPIVCCGERITERALALLRYYGIERCLVMKEH